MNSTLVKLKDIEGFKEAEMNEEEKKDKEKDNSQKDKIEEKK